MIQLCNVTQILDKKLAQLAALYCILAILKYLFLSTNMGVYDLKKIIKSLVISSKLKRPCD